MSPSPLRIASAHVEIRYEDGTGYVVNLARTEDHPIDGDIAVRYDEHDLGATGAEPWRHVVPGRGYAKISLDGPIKTAHQSQT